jgi:hypothetical protein
MRGSRAAFRSGIGMPKQAFVPEAPAYHSIVPVWNFFPF